MECSGSAEFTSLLYLLFPLELGVSARKVQVCVLLGSPEGERQTRRHSFLLKMSSSPGLRFQRSGCCKT